MIRARLTAAMVSVFLPDFWSDFAEIGGRLDMRKDFAYLDASEDVLASLARDFAAHAKTIADVKGRGTERRIAIAAAERITEAIAKAERRSVAPIPISIPVEEQEALRALAADPGVFVATPRTLIDRMRRRGLLSEDDDLSDRGRAVVAGTPPGDLVPFPFLSSGVRVRLAFDLDPADPNVFQDLRAGHECVIDTAEDGRVWLLTDDGPRIFLAVERAHPRLFYVVARPKP